jgi:hypothetical protein
MKHILQDVCNISAQTPNWAKSGILFNKHVDTTTTQVIQHIFLVLNVDVNFVHLGHPLIIPGKDRNASYNLVIDKFKIQTINL